MFSHVVVGVSKEVLPVPLNFTPTVATRGRTALVERRELMGGQAVSSDVLFPHNSERIQRRITWVLDQIEDAADQREWDQIKKLAEDFLAFAPDTLMPVHFQRALPSAG